MRTSIKITLIDNSRISERTLDHTMNRRHFLTLLTACYSAPYLKGAEALTKRIRLDHWDRSHDRLFLGGQFWTNPMEDWLIQDGWASCQTSGANRNIHSLLYQLSDTSKPFTISTEVSRPESLKKDDGAGFRFGIRADIDDHRARCFSYHGETAGLKGKTLFIGKKETTLEGKIPAHYELTLTGKPSGDKVELTLTVSNPDDGASLGSVSATVAAKQVAGNFSVVSQFTGNKGRPANAGYQFRNWQISGEAFSHHPERQFGPIMWSMYTLSDNRSDDGYVMKITALLAPMGEKDNQKVELEVQKDGAWKKLGSAELNTDAWTATFRVPKWDEKTKTPFRLIYREQHTDSTETAHEWTGTIRSNPTGPLRMGALTCQNDYGFPYAPVAENLSKLDLDLLYFSGDQLYENHGGFGIIRTPAIPAIHNYLRKFYQFGWSFREPMRHSPTVCLPDDHDVFHGNIWGEGGAPFNPNAKGPSRGGYRQPARMVNAVHLTNCSHHPDYASPKPCKQDISVYYGDMVYGGVNFAIIADRQWKSGPEHVNTEGSRYDHVADKDFDTSKLDKPGLQMLGERQEKYVEEWAKDWRAHSMKVFLSQTVFAGVATHHGSPKGYLKGDLDSGGWPQTARNKAIDLMRPSMALHINGDQHLTSLSQYGVDKQRDSNWSFCTPAISAGYPRWWLPDELGMEHENRPDHNNANTGEFLDGFGNKVYVYAIGNPVKNPREGAKTRYELAHNKASGFGMITIDTEKKTYTMDCFRFLCDATDGKKENQFPGWPVTIHQKENRGENLLNA
ncbi:PhoD-like phosphatase [Rubritalea squalenifaciens DSM 18772]|uniref:PhoD-like phosphatase n=2 Tax=Rubritalea squalenifaciens TaxID=407226 RepID=A0A1M6CX28_9BACT|nr:PhoD-like phosphatase [Rubritalea squalenifaciens DSM 18772]